VAIGCFDHPQDMFRLFPLPRSIAALHEAGSVRFINNYLQLCMICGLGWGNDCFVRIDHTRFQELDSKCSFTPAFVLLNGSHVSPCRKAAISYEYYTKIRQSSISTKYYLYKSLNGDSIITKSTYAHSGEELIFAPLFY